MELNTHLWIPEILDSTVSSRKPKVKVKGAQSCPTLCDPIDYTVHGILQATILEWIAFPFSRGPSQHRDWTQVYLIAEGFFTSWATREAQEYWSGWPIPSSADLPDPGIKPRSPALQEDSLPTELWGSSKPKGKSRCHKWKPVKQEKQKQNPPPRLCPPWVRWKIVLPGILLT